MMLSLLLSMYIYADVHKLNYTYKDTKLMVITEATDYPDAIDKGSDKCFAFYLKMFGFSSLSEDDRLDLVDTCTNPRK